MQIREAKSTDIPEIISVLRSSLGEKDLPISENIWNYKHIQNPFGKSLVLVAQEGERIVGVRAFMRWNWQRGKSYFTTFRAVDTATHPDFQGKGVFKKLTLKAVEMAEKEGDSFVFNTPNNQSRPGYIKMGWDKVGKIEVGVRPSVYSLWNFSKKIPVYQTLSIGTKEEFENLLEVWNTNLTSSEKIFTPKTPAYLKWRYELNPLQEYEIYASPDLYISAYVKKRKRFKELRVSEFIHKNENAKKRAMRIIKELSMRFNVNVISYSPKISGTLNISYTGYIGPVLTVRKLEVGNEEWLKIRNIDNWSYSLGDLELF